MEPFSSLATVTNFLIASSFPLRIASGISAAFPSPAPTCPLPSPTTTKAVKRNLIDASQLELEDKVVSIKRVPRLLKVVVTSVSQL